MRFYSILWNFFTKFSNSDELIFAACALLHKTVLCRINKLPEGDKVDMSNNVQ